MLSTNYCDYNFSNPDYDVIDRPYGTPEYLFLYFQTPMKIRLNGTLHMVTPGACLLIPPHTETYYQAVCHFKNSFIHFFGDEVDELVKLYDNLPINEIFYLPDVDSVNQIIKDVFYEFIAKDYLFEERIDNLIRNLLITISRQLHTSSNSSRSTDLYVIFQKARLEILTHPEQAWTSQSMAALTNLGCSQFYHYYVDFFHRSPKADLLESRIERAKYLLLHESFTVAMVAESCGFGNLSHFTRYFKKQCGVTPGAYRSSAAKRWGPKICT